MLKQAQIAVVLRDLREKRDSLDNVIELLEKTYNLKGLGEVEQEFEDLAATVQEKAKPWSKRNGGSPTLGQMVLDVMEPRLKYTAKFVKDCIEDRYRVDAKMQSIAAQLSQYYNKGLLGRPEKGIYTKGGGDK